MSPYPPSRYAPHSGSGNKSLIACITRSRDQLSRSSFGTSVGRCNGNASPKCATNRPRSSYRPTGRMRMPVAASKSRNSPAPSRAVQEFGGRSHCPLGHQAQNSATFCLSGGGAHGACPRRGGSIRRRHRDDAVRGKCALEHRPNQPSAECRCPRTKKPPIPESRSSASPARCVFVRRG